MPRLKDLEVEPRLDHIRNILFGFRLQDTAAVVLVKMAGQLLGHPFELPTRKARGLPARDHRDQGVRLSASVIERLHQFVVEIALVSSPHALVW